MIQAAVNITGLSLRLIVGTEATISGYLVISCVMTKTNDTSNGSGLCSNHINI